MMFASLLVPQIKFLGFTLKGVRKVGFNLLTCNWITLFCVRHVDKHVRDEKALNGEHAKITFHLKFLHGNVISITAKCYGCVTWLFLSITWTQPNRMLMIARRSRTPRFRLDCANRLYIFIVTTNTFCHFHQQLDILVVSEIEYSPRYSVSLSYSVPIFTISIMHAKLHFC